MPYFTFTFREQVFQAQYEALNNGSNRVYRVHDLPENLQALTKQDITLTVSNGIIEKPSTELASAVAEGLSQTLKGINNF